MDNKVKLRFLGEERELNYSVAVMFDAVERFDNVARMLDVIQRNTKEGFEAVRWLAVQLVNDGELCRREEGYDKLPMVREKDFPLRMGPADYEMIRAAVIAAITAGYKRDLTSEEEERDLGLEELESKKPEAGD